MMGRAKASEMSKKYTETLATINEIIIIYPKFLHEKMASLYFLKIKLIYNFFNKFESLLLSSILLNLKFKLSSRIYSEAKNISMLQSLDKIRLVCSLNFLHPKLEKIY